MGRRKSYGQIELNWIVFALSFRMRRDGHLKQPSEDTDAKEAGLCSRISMSEKVNKDSRIQTSLLTPISVKAVSNGNSKDNEKKIVTNLLFLSCLHDC